MKAAVLKSNSFYMRNLAVICLAEQDKQWPRRMAAAVVGYMNIAQQIEPGRLDPLATGFANAIEALVMGQPRMMIFSNSYHNENRELGNDPRAWLHLVQDRVRTKKVSGVRALLAMDTTTMLLPHFRRVLDAGRAPDEAAGEVRQARCGTPRGERFAQGHRASLRVGREAARRPMAQGSVGAEIMHPAHSVSAEFRQRSFATVGTRSDVGYNDDGRVHPATRNSDRCPRRVRRAGGWGGLRQDVRAHRTLPRLPRPAAARRPPAPGPVDGHHLHRTGGAGNARADPQDLPGTPEKPRRKSTSSTGSARSATWMRRGFPRSTRSAARCCGPTPWKPGSTRTFRCWTPRPPQTLLFELIDEQLRERLADGDEAVIDLVVKFGLDGLREMASRLLDQRQQIDWDAWREETPERLLARWEKFWREWRSPRICWAR